jgi:hypothetical protein
VFNFIIGLFQWIIGFFGSLPEETRNKIIAAIVATYEELFRAYYKENKSEEKNA